MLEQKSHDADYAINDLAEDMTLSESQLNRKLNGLIGKTVGKTLRLFRFHKAKILLKTTNLTISEVSFQAGFKDPSYFTRKFKAAYNMTPSIFRESGVGT